LFSAISLNVLARFLRYASKRRCVAMYIGGGLLLLIVVIILLVWVF
jgi:hypothetical protein